jgi:endonuclease/exonuclease/phosphatase family metal-dependent hydrolase
MIVAIWNMAKRPAAWSHLLQGLAPDVALLQETARPPVLSPVAQLLHDPDYASNSLGSAIYVRDGAARQLELRPERRVWFTAAEVELQGASPLVAVSVHTPTVPSARPFIGEAFEELSPLLEGRSFIVGGDFNLSRNYDKVYGTRTTPSSSTAFPPGVSSTACARPSGTSSGPSGGEPRTPPRTITSS